MTTQSEDSRIHRCDQCGTLLYSDGSCLTCEIARNQPPIAKATKKTAKARPKLADEEL